MKEAEVIQGMADAMVSRGQVDAEQAAQWKAADLAALDGSAAPAGLQPNDVGGSSLDTQIRARAEELVRTGQMTREQADQALNHFASTPPAEGEPTQAAAPEKPPAALAASNAPNPFEGVTLPDGFGPPEKASDYRLDSLVTGQLTTDQLRNVGETLHAARLPAPIATQIVSEIASFEAQNLDEKGLRMVNQRTMAQLDRLWGSERDAKIKTAQTFLQDLEKVRPGVMRLLNESGAGSSPIVIQQIALHAERINAARGK